MKDYDTLSNMILLVRGEEEMKRIMKSLILVITLCVTIGIFELVNAETSYTEDGYVYTVTENQATIIDYNGLSGNVIIPEELGGYPVTCIGREAFAGIINITGVEIPESVTTIEPYAFNTCVALERVIIPETTVNFGSGDAFYACPKLLSAGPIGGDYNIQFGWTTHIPEEALSGSNIETMVFPSEVTSIGSAAFFDCAYLKNIVIPETITDLGYQTFAYCSALESIEIPEGITRLRGHVFRECSSLTYVKIPQSVTEMGSDNFSKCPKLLTAGPVNGGYNIEFSWNKEIPANAFNGAGISKIVIPEGITHISEDAFAFCGNLCDITLPSTIESTEQSSLDSCAKIKTAGPAGGDYNLKLSCSRLTKELMGEFKYLTEIVVPDGATISTDAFYGMKSLEKVVIGKDITSIHANAFYGANSNVVLHVYEYSYAHKYAATRKKHCFLIDKNKSYYVSTPLGISINDENQIRIIGCQGTYKGTVEIPEEMYGFPVAEIADEAFGNCLKVTGITIPSSVKSIGSYAFKDCDSLKEITIPDSVTHIGTFAFYSCNLLEEITIPDSINNLEMGFFYQCSSLKDVNLPANLKTIGVNAFYKCSSLENIYLPETITQIRGGAFSNCTSLAYIELPGSITAIEAGTFSNCKKLADLSIPDKVTSIGDSAFYSCSNLSKIIIPKSVTSIYGNAFVSTTNTFYVYEGTYGETFAAKRKHELIKETENLYYYTDNEAIVITGVKAKNLSSLDIEKEFKNVEYTQIKIEYGAFRDCNELKNIAIPEKVSVIGNKAFYGCSALTDIFFNGSKTIWNEIDKGVENTNLINAALHCSIPIETNVSDNGKTVTISCENIENGNLVILAIYSDDKFVNLYSDTYQGEDIVFNNVNYVYNRIKVMVWNEMSEMMPACRPDEIYINTI